MNVVRLPPQLKWTALLAVAVSVAKALGDEPVAVGRRLVIAVAPQAPTTRAVVLADGQPVAERGEPPFVFVLRGTDLGEGAHRLAVRVRTDEGEGELGRAQLAVDPDALDATRSLCILVQDGQTQATPPVGHLLPALEKGVEPLDLVRRVAALVGDYEELQDARDLLVGELESWGGAVLLLAEKLEQTKLHRAIKLLSAFTDIPLSTSATAKALQTLARLCDENGDPEGGIAACERLLAESPDGPSAHAETMLRLAYCLGHARRAAESERMLERVAAECAKTNPRAAAIAKADLAFNRCFSEGASAESVRLTREALRALPAGDPARITIQARIAMYYQAMGDLEQALAEYRKVSPGRGTDPSWNYDCRVCVPRGTATVLAKLGRLAEAREVLEAAIERYKGDEWVVRRLRLLLPRYEEKESVVP